jgi:predicted nucleic acid-binding Zn finger protein
MKRNTGWTHVAYVASASSPGEEWEVRRHTSTGRLGCACPKYRFARGEKTCHHITSVLQTDVSTERPASPNVNNVVSRTYVDGEMFCVRRAIALGGLDAAMEHVAAKPARVVKKAGWQDFERALLKRRGRRTFITFEDVKATWLEVHGGG